MNPLALLHAEFCMSMTDAGPFQSILYMLLPQSVKRTHHVCKLTWVPDIQPYVMGLSNFEQEDPPASVTGNNGAFNNLCCTGQLPHTCPPLALLRQTSSHHHPLSTASQTTLASHNITSWNLKLLVVIWATSGAECMTSIAISFGKLCNRKMWCRHGRKFHCLAK